MAVLGLGVLPGSALAAVNSCHVFYGPDAVRPSASSTYTFNVNNGMLTPMRVVMIDPPAEAGVTVESVSAEGFVSTTTDNGVAVYGGEVPPGSSLNVTVTASVGPQLGVLGAWSTVISDNNDLSVTCSGSQNLVVNAATTGIHITNVGVVNVAQTGVTVAWDTDVPATSQVRYGATPAYGRLSGLDSRLTLNHRVNLTGLAPDSTYHFVVSSTVPAAGASNNSLDNTFITAGVPPPLMQAGAVPGAVPKESAPPVVAPGAVPGSPQADSPTLSGTASDNAGVSGVDYSVNNGVSWRPVDALSPAGGGLKVTYSFKPVLPDDGSYAVRVRAVDSSGNVAVSGAQTLVIDRLAPHFAVPELRLGRRVVPPDTAGRWQVVAGQEAQVWIAEVGGSVQAALQAKLRNSGAPPQAFAMQPDAGQGLWHGVLALAAPGAYDISIAAGDGAGNHTEQMLGELVIVRPGRITTGLPARAVAGARVTLYCQTTDTKQWTIWDGSSYDQANPVTVDGGGSVAYAVPPGTYYVAVSAPGYRPMTSRIVALDRAGGLTPVFHLVPWQIPIWPVVMDTAVVTGGSAAGIRAGAAGKLLPDVPLPLAAGGILHRVDLLGEPVVVTVMGTWSDAAPEQLPQLAGVMQSGKARVVVVVPGERSGRVAAFWASGRYEVPAVSDGHMEAVGALGATGTMAHYIIDRAGMIRQVLYGVVGERQLVDAVTGL